jgi:curved DNA-binding protein CbpA
MSKDYYRVLGVLDDAEGIVIKAAYKALAQRYHPDKWVGGKDEATRRMSDINEAYNVLSNPEKRKEYDSSRGRSEYQEESEDDDLNTSVKSDWDEVVNYFPDLVGISENLRKISLSLEYSYKVLLLETKEFKNRQTLAEVIKRQFFERYFGSNEIILNYAESLITHRYKGAAKDLNKAVSLLGSDVSPEVIIDRINKKWALEKHTEINKLIKVAKLVLLNTSLIKSMEFIEKMGGKIQGPMDDKRFKVTLRITYYFNDEEIINFSKTLASDYLKERGL